MLLKISPSINTPSINFDIESGHLNISGRCINTDLSEIFNRVMAHTMLYIEQPKNQTVLNLQFEYVNTEGIVYLRRVLSYFTKLVKGGLEVTVNWYYETDDDCILSLGQDLSHIFNIIKFNFIEVED